jgi:hypothetical protein
MLICNTDSMISDEHGMVHKTRIVAGSWISLSSSRKRIMISWKNSSRKQSRPNQGIIPGFAWNDSGKPRKISTTIAGISAELRTEHLHDRVYSAVCIENAVSHRHVSGNGATSICVRATFEFVKTLPSDHLKMLLQEYLYAYPSDSCL